MLNEKRQRQLGLWLMVVSLLLMVMFATSEAGATALSSDCQLLIGCPPASL